MMIYGGVAGYHLHEEFYPVSYFNKVYGIIGYSNSSCVRIGRALSEDIYSASIESSISTHKITIRFL